MSSGEASDSEAVKKARAALNRAQRQLSGDKADAVDAARQAVRLAPQDPETLLDAAVVMFFAGQADAAAQVLTDLGPIVETGPPGFAVRALGVSGYVKQALGDLDAAEAAFRFALGADPAAEWAAGLAMLLIQQGRAVEAHRVVAGARERAPDDGELHTFEASLASYVATDPSSRTSPARVTWDFGDWPTLRLAPVGDTPGGPRRDVPGENR